MGCTLHIPISVSFDERYLPIANVSRSRHFLFLVVQSDAMQQRTVQCNDLVQNFAQRPKKEEMLRQLRQL